MTPDDQPLATELSVELETKLLYRLREDWADLNYSLFRNRLRPPVLQLSSARQRLGQWHRELRCLEISRPLVLERPWVQVIEVLKHEMAHQFVHECMYVVEPPHGPAFRSVCEKLGLDARATGEPAAEVDPGDGAERILDRVRKLLALAESPNQHEAELAAATARRLMLKFNIDHDRASAGRTDQRRAYGFRHLGRPTGRTFEHERWIGSILAQYFFVEVLWIPVYRPLEGKRGTVLEVCGLEPNLAMAEHVHAFLSAAAERLWLDYKKTTGRSSNRDRQAFLAGVMRGFESKLAAQTRELQQEGLVWVSSPDLDAYLRRRHPRIRSVGSRGAQRNDAFGHGQQAGREIVLSRPVESGTSGGRPKALREG